MKQRWIVSWIFNDITHAKSFKEYDKAMSLYHSLERNGYNPSVSQE